MAEKFWRYSPGSSDGARYVRLRGRLRREVAQSRRTRLTVRPHRFAETFCSSCGCALGSGNHGLSHCVDHQGAP